MTIDQAHKAAAVERAHAAVRAAMEKEFAPVIKGHVARACSILDRYCDERKVWPDEVEIEGTVIKTQVTFRFKTKTK